MRIFRIICYTAMLAVVAAIVATWAISRAGVCPRFDEAAIECISPIYETLASGALTVLVFAAFGFPLSLPLVGGGLVFAVVDGVRWWRKQPVEASRAGP